MDVSKPMGERVSGLEYKWHSDNSWVPLGTNTSYTVVTNSYVAGGRNGYLTFKTVKNDGRSVDTYLNDAQSFVDYVQARGNIGKLPVSEYSTQRITR